MDFGQAAFDRVVPMMKAAESRSARISLVRVGRVSATADEPTVVNFVAVRSLQKPQNATIATGALGGPKANVANKSVTYVWSGRPDSNWRPPAPKAWDRMIGFNDLRIDPLYK